MSRVVAPTLMQVVSLSIECADCGRMRWRKPEELYRFRGINASTPLSRIGERLSCSSCVDAGAQGKNIVVQAAFSFELDRERAAAWRLKSQEVRVAG
ncbi:hypothetical protein [Agrobacterium tumefaciens]|uniref:hypothetical protein n=1 Tax=Agrobacterium tumefaciens TaxID=358 RepID=UPI0021D0138A|nr:hypothetical protein [Agrobacterium tumefaciens]UXT96742.1 hypothetical protein FY129_04390 [Agrobacterium tumefaciens]